MIEACQRTKIQWSTKVTVVVILLTALGTVFKGLVKGLEELEIRRSLETIQTTALLRSVKILRRVLETGSDLLSPRHQWETTN